jgi:hypothetical protein
MRLGLATSLQAFSLALSHFFGQVICETMDFHPFFRIHLKSLPRKKEAMTLITPSPLLISGTGFELSVTLSCRRTD